MKSCNMVSHFWSSYCRCFLLRLCAIRLGKVRVDILSWVDILKLTIVCTGHVNDGQYLKIGKWKNWNSVFSVKDMHCRQVLTFFLQSDNFLPKLIDILLFSTKKETWISILWNSSIFGYRIYCRTTQLNCLTCNFPCLVFSRHFSPVRRDDQVSDWGFAGSFPQTDEHGKTTHVRGDREREIRVPTPGEALHAADHYQGFKHFGGSRNSQTVRTSCKFDNYFFWENWGADLRRNPHWPRACKFACKSFDVASNVNTPIRKSRFHLLTFVLDRLV